MPPRYQGSERQRRALDSYIKLMRAADTVTSRVRESIAASGLTETQFALMEALHHCGPLRACDLSRKLLRSSANITTVLDNLEKAGLVTRKHSKSDRRAVSVALTGAGAARIRETFPAVAARIDELMSALGESEQERLGILCRKLGLQLPATDSGRPPSDSSTSND
ncbi:MAG TPA: MarR family transcriptional regulator [Solibacterales bacterium]|nr:MarR family transcriptional regulator [Bryobacterales bacterium]